MKKEKKSMTFSDWMAVGTGGEPLSCEVAFEGGKKIGRMERQTEIDDLEKKIIRLQESLVVRLFHRDPKSTDRFVDIDKVKELLHNLELGLNKLSGEGLITKGK